MFARCGVGRMASAGAPPASAQSYPIAPHHGDHSLTPGNANDITARIVLEQVSRRWVRPSSSTTAAGAGGTIGVGAAARAGARRLHHPVPFGVVQFCLCHPQDAALRHVQGFHRRSRRSAFRRVLVVSPSSGCKPAADLIAAAKAKPGAMNFASAGIGAASHLAAEKFNVAAGIKSQHVPFKGPVEALTEVMAGRIDYYFLPIAPAWR